jgi:hypothetical protein
METRNGIPTLEAALPPNHTAQREEEWESITDHNELERRRRSSPASPGSPRARITPKSPTQDTDRRRHSSRLKAGPSSPRSPPGEHSPRQRAKTADAASVSRSKMSPLVKRSEEEPAPVVDFSMEGMQLGVSMDDILDPLAAPRRQGSTTGQQAGANIAPWLMDDSNPSPSGTPSPGQGNPSFSPNSTKPQLHRLQSDMSMKTTASSRNGSQPSINTFTQESPEGRSRHGSGDSIQTLSAVPPKPAKDVLPGGGRHSIVGSRAGRFGSTASSASAAPAEKKKGGFLGGLLKRKGTGMSLGTCISAYRH